MAFHLIIKEEAEEEIRVGYDWYEERQHGLGAQFKSELDEYFKRISASPQHFAAVYKNYHHAVLQKFPFRIIFSTEGNTVYVFAVFHTKRNPKKFLKRIRRKK